LYGARRAASVFWVGLGGTALSAWFWLATAQCAACDSGGLIVCHGVLSIAVSISKVSAAIETRLNTPKYFRTPLKTLDDRIRNVDAATVLSEVVAYSENASSFACPWLSHVTPHGNHRGRRNLPRRMYENYLLNATAIAETVNALDNSRTDPLTPDTARWTG